MKASTGNDAKVFKISGEHIREVFPIDKELFNLKKDLGDLAYLVKKKNSQEKVLIYLHVEHQSTPDQFAPLRTALYTLGTLYEYAKMNPKENLPEVYSIIYYHGKKAYPYPTNIWEQFNQDYDAKTYLFTPNFVDLNKTSDQVLLSHQPIAGAEFAFKHIFAKEFDPFTEFLAKSLKPADGEIIKNVIRYVYHAGNTSDSEAYLDKITKNLEKEKEKDMGTATIAELLHKRGFREGMAQGAEQSSQEIAKRMAQQGFDQETIKTLTGLSDTDLNKIINAH